MLSGPAFIQAGLDYQEAGVDQQIQRHIAACEGHSVELDRAFIMAVEMGSFYSRVCSNHTKVYFQLQV